MSVPARGLTTLGLSKADEINTPTFRVHQRAAPALSREWINTFIKQANHQTCSFEAGRGLRSHCCGERFANVTSPRLTVSLLMMW